MKRTAKRVLTEREEGIILHTWLELNNILHVYVPTALPLHGRQAIVSAVELKRRGVAKGFPDYLIFDVPTPWRGIAIELKRKKGGRTSQEQLYWLHKLTALGWACAICNGAQEAIDYISNIIGVKKCGKVNGQS